MPEQAPTIFTKREIDDLRKTPPSERVVATEIALIKRGLVRAFYHSVRISKPDIKHEDALKAAAFQADLWFRGGELALAGAAQSAQPRVLLPSEVKTG
jgi:hypothetical protein